MADPITTAEFKTRYDREFTYGAGLDSVRDKDIEDAFSAARVMYNPALFTTEQGKTAFLLVSAHYLTVNIQAAGGLSTLTSQGIKNRSEGIVISKSVGQVSVTYDEVPARVKQLGLQALWMTKYGQDYVTMLLPKLVGNVSVVSGPVVNEAGLIPVPDAGP